MGSNSARPNEFLVLRLEEGTWTAYDSAFGADGETLQCRQAVFRCRGRDITQPGFHTWEMNLAASTNNDGQEVDWSGDLWAETRVP